VKLNTLETLNASLKSQLQIYEASNVELANLAASLKSIEALNLDLWLQFQTAEAKVEDSYLNNPKPEKRSSKIQKHYPVQSLRSLC